MSRRSVVVRRTRRRARLDSWALVLEALAIPYRIHRPDGAFRHHSLVVELRDAERARAALDGTDREENEHTEVARETIPDHGPSSAPFIVAVVLLVIYWLSGPSGSPARPELFIRGSADTERILAGEWWRILTALSLHADVSHLLGNLLAGALFLGFTARWLGGGLASALAVASGAAGNFATALYYGSDHLSVGASTAIFGTLGILAGLQFVRRGKAGSFHSRRRRWFRAWPVLAACLALFSMLGVSGERVDVVGHAAGLSAGLLIGILTPFLPPLGAWQDRSLGIGAALLMAVAWLLALGGI